ncbi:Mom family adenine methylcarbamoylation protein [Noviherbaspirillum pedocola]|uniref:Uncharacterized protein n=1 Tax=Noviherbaspirillum pedocola TaxID=2801341 RepID=A0A934SUX7_9BURK|nr:hypothetical protein [Noviherbaspirillum pedocola]MBK4736192.1 hypothetical protein [Noviherbaspirillum pedocola]
MTETRPLFSRDQLCQRWTRKRVSFRPAGEPFNTSRHEVVLIGEAEAKAFCGAHHYSGSMPPARVRVGMMRKMPFQRDELVGLALFSVPMQAASLSKWLKADMETGVECGRFLCTDVVEGNGESFLIAAANRILARETRITSVLAYADPLPRYDEDANLIKYGHVGVIYMASNARLLGRSKPRTLIITPSGHVVSERSLAKIRKQESGSAYAYRQLLVAGAPERRFGEDPADYVTRALAEGPFRRLPHPGNYVYGWSCGNRLERRMVNNRLGEGLPYPGRPIPHSESVTAVT